MGTIMLTILVLLYLTYLFKIFSFSLEDNFLINSISKLLTSHIVLFRLFQNYFLVFLLAMSIIVVTDFISTLFLRRIYIICSISFYSYIALVPFLAISHTTYFLKNGININWRNFLAPTAA